jgi:kinesin family protein 2/24
MAIHDLFRLSSATFIVSFFEIYGGRCFDLFNNRAKLNILEDGNQNIIISGVTE